MKVTPPETRSQVNLSHPLKQSECESECEETQRKLKLSVRERESVRLRT
jgi:hypothetical protein